MEKFNLVITLKAKKLAFIQYHQSEIGYFLKTKNILTDYTPVENDEKAKKEYKLVYMLQGERINVFEQAEFFSKKYPVVLISNNDRFYFQNGEQIYK